MSGTRPTVHRFAGERCHYWSNPHPSEVTTDELSVPPIRGRVRRRDWERLSHGVFLPAQDRCLAEELHAWRLVLPRTAAFSHLTVAELMDWWLPAGIPHPVFVAMSNDDPRARRPGLFVCRHTQPFAITIIDGLPVTTAAETLLAAARDLGVLDLVIMADAALRLKHCTLTELMITARQRRRGAPVLRSVIPLLDPRSESPWESIMRVLHRAAGIPVTPQHEVVDDFGRFVARVDLRIDGTRRAHEYDGADHREAEVHEQDLARDRRLLGAGWQRHGFTSRQLLSSGAEIIADADRLLGRTWDPRRLSAWQHLVEHSLYGRSGRARAYRQWQRTRPAAKPVANDRRST
jgi:very-short-patch-repair endonuclease